VIQIRLIGEILQFLKQSRQEPIFQVISGNDQGSFEGTVSRDWGELLMVEIDKTCFFNVAGDGFYSILIMFSYRKVLKTRRAGSSF